jgi:hypothetical protein
MQMGRTSFDSKCVNIEKMYEIKNNDNKCGFYAF